MARVTVEDCVLKIPNRFDLVMLAAQRARNVSSGAQITIERDNDKNPVVALREIAEETINLEDLGESLVKGLQKHVETDEPEEDLPEFDMAGLAGALSDAGDGSTEVPDALSSFGPGAGTADGQTEGFGSATAFADNVESDSSESETPSEDLSVKDVDPGALMGGEAEAGEDEPK